MEYAWVGIGGASGAIARFLVGRWAVERFSAGFPYGTLIANLSGCCLIGIVMAVLTERNLANPAWRLFLVVGTLGGYTTLSSFSYETVTMLEQGRVARALVYFAASNAGGLAACAMGLALTKAVLR